MYPNGTNYPGSDAALEALRTPSASESEGLLVTIGRQREMHTAVEVGDEVAERELAARGIVSQTPELARAHQTLDRGYERHGQLFGDQPRPDGTVVYANFDRQPATVNDNVPSIAEVTDLVAARRAEQARADLSASYDANTNPQTPYYDPDLNPQYGKVA